MSQANRMLISTVQQRSRLTYSIIVFVLLALVFYSVTKVSRSTDLLSKSLVAKVSTSREQASNSTLGFEKILALSSGPSWRTRGLEAAAQISGLEIDIPHQPFISDEAINAYMELGATDSSKKRPGFGSARAWLGHIDLIKFAVASNLESVLIIEDDVDWDVSIRDEMGMLSDAIRVFLETPLLDLSPYGTGWDVLWIGHCGEVTEPDTHRHEYRDDTLMPEAFYAGWSKKWLYNIPDGYRAIQKSKKTVCTFAYGLSRQGCDKALHTLGNGRNEAFDIALSAECSSGALNCITINPELMHHYNPKDGTGYVSPNMEANGKGHSSDESAFENIKGTTANMKNSARCAALFHEKCPQPPLG